MSLDLLSMYQGLSQLSCSIAQGGDIGLAGGTIGIEFLNKQSQHQLPEDIIQRKSTRRLLSAESLSAKFQERIWRRSSLLDCETPIHWTVVNTLDRNNMRRL